MIQTETNFICGTKNTVCCIFVRYIIDLSSTKLSFYSFVRCGCCDLWEAKSRPRRAQNRHTGSSWCKKFELCIFTVLNKWWDYKYFQWAASTSLSQVIVFKLLVYSVNNTCPLLFYIISLYPTPSNAVCSSEALLYETLMKP